MSLIDRLDDNCRLHRTRRRTPQDEATPEPTPAAWWLQQQWHELGETIGVDECQTILSRLHHDGIADIYRDAIQSSIAVKRARRARKLARRLETQRQNGTQR